MTENQYKGYAVLLSASYAGPISQVGFSIGRTLQEAEANYEPIRREIENKFNRGKDRVMKTTIFAELSEATFPGFKIIIEPLEQRVSSQE